MTSYSDELPTICFVTQYMIRVIGNQIASASLPLLEVSSGSEFYCLKNYYVAFNVNTMNLSINYTVNAIVFYDLVDALFIKQHFQGTSLGRNVNKLNQAYS